MNFTQGATLAAITPLLRDCGLPSDDIAPADLAHFVVADDGQGPVGVIGLQAFGEVGLLRSAAVAPAARGAGLGAQLVARLEARARALGIRTLYLLTNDAQGFFARCGYAEACRDTAPAAIRGTAQFGSSCCCGATLMRRELA